MKTLFYIDINIAEEVGFEEAALLAWFNSTAEESIVKTEEDKVWIYTGYAVLHKAHTYWSKPKIEKLLAKLELFECIYRKDGENASRFWVYLSDNMLTKEQSVSKNVVVVDARESKVYSVMLPAENGILTQTDMSGGQIVAKIISFITKVNPDAVKFYSWKHERAAILTMLDQSYDPSILCQMAHCLPMTHGKQFAPVITSPQEFATKFSKLVAYVNKEILTKQAEKDNTFAI